MQNTDNVTFDASDVLVYLYKKRIPVLLITAIGAIASIVVSLVITPKFKASVVMFPASTGSLSKALLSDIPTRNDIYRLGEEEDAEQLLQILQSEQIKGRIIQKYNLFEHYKISKQGAFPLTAVNKEYQSNVTFRKTRFQSVEVTVMDTDPVTAAAMANDITDLVDTIYNQMVNQRATEALLMVEKEYKSFGDSIKAIENELLLIKQNGLLDHEAESKSYSEAYAQGLANGTLNDSKKAAFQKKFDIMAKYGARYQFLSNLLKEQGEKYATMAQHYAEARINANQTIPHKFVLNRAWPPEKKAYPVRWLIVVLSTISSFLFAIVWLLLTDLFIKVRQKAKQH